VLQFKKFRSSRSRQDETQADLVSSSPDRKHSHGSTFTSDRRSSATNWVTARSEQLEGASSDRSPTPSPGPQVGSLGLHILHKPDATAPLDIIFVHGLGGDSRKTWSKNHDPDLFWPGRWLPLEPDIGKARIFSFGYNAGFRVGTAKSIANIADFAKDLLFEMRFAKDDNGDDWEIGSVPIIFVVHSMGGLVVKKAYLLGQNDEEYQDVVRSISAIIFLATPHRGTNLAEHLNRILAVSFQSSKNFIGDLNKSSPALEELNEQFRHIAMKLSIVSFYETLATTVVGPVKFMVLEKDSSTLGYPKEISKALTADHHDVCKYSSPADPNYVSVRNILRSLVERFRSKGADVVNHRALKEAEELERLLGASLSAESDFSHYHGLWLPGTCEWFRNDPRTKIRLDDGARSSVLWFSGPPASGKSVLSAYAIRHLIDSGHSCQYFFFKFGDPAKRSLASALRSLAHQIARDNPSFRRQLVELSAEGFRLEKADATLIWQKVFQSTLFRAELTHPLYWVIDALDESESPRAFFELLRGMSESRVAVRVFIISRRTDPLFLACERLSRFLDVETMEMTGDRHNAADIRLYVENEITDMRGSEDLKQEIMQRILTRAEGNFLWVRLVLEEVLRCHSEPAIVEILEELPGDMTELYRRMESTIIGHKRLKDRALAKALMQWIICARRPLTVRELSQALGPDFGEFLDLHRTIQDVCAQFVTVDHAGNVSMVHQTAREYILSSAHPEIAVDQRLTHEELCQKSLSCLMDRKLRSKLTRGEHALQGTEPFVFYAATSWAYHLRQSQSVSGEILDMLVNFVKGPYVLTWIHLLSLIGELEVLVKAAKSLASFVSMNRKMNALQNPMLHRLSDLDLLDLWIIDLVKVVGKFNTYLLADPLCIYKLVPRFCPERSIIHKQFCRTETAGISITGAPNTDWNDNLTKLSLPNTEEAGKIICAGPHVAVLDSRGTVYVWDATNFKLLCTLRHSESVTCISLNSQGSKVVSYGLHTTKLWSIPSGELLSAGPSPRNGKAITMTFAPDGKKILAGLNDNTIRCIDLADFARGWHLLDGDLLKEKPQAEGALAYTPMFIDFNADATQVAVCYRGFPLSVWAVDEARLIGRCKRAKELRHDHARPSTNWYPVNRFTWNPMTGHVIGVYKDGCILKWHPVSDDNEEVSSDADEIEASPDGKLFATSSSDGTVRVWSFAYFAVIYQLSSGDLVTGLAFGPSGTRFYDLRGSTINAWEPNSLIRFAENEEIFSDTASEDQAPTLVSQVSEAWLAQFEAVTAVGAAPGRPWYCVGNEEGLALLCDVQTGHSIELARFSNFFGVSHLVWDQTAQHVVAADLGRDIVVRSVNASGSPDAKKNLEASPIPIPRADLEGQGIYQLLLNSELKMLLIVSDDRLQVLPFDRSSPKAIHRIEHATSRGWVRHPTQATLFLGFGVQDVKIFRWDDLTEVQVLEYCEDRPRLSSHTSFDADDRALDRGMNSLDIRQTPGHSVGRTILTQDGKHILVELKESLNQARRSKRLLIFPISALASSDDTPPSRTIKYLYLPPKAMLKVEVPLGILPGGILVFLDQDLWLCTFRLGSSHEEGPRRHYFIPRDWATTVSLEQCCLMADGTFLCPRDDQVTMIRSSIGLSDF